MHLALVLVFNSYKKYSITQEHASLLHEILHCKTGYFLVRMTKLQTFNPLALARLQTTQVLQVQPLTYPTWASSQVFQCPEHKIIHVKNMHARK